MVWPKSYDVDRIILVMMYEGLRLDLSRELGALCESAQLMSALSRHRSGHENI